MERMQHSTLLRWSHANVLTKRRYDALKRAFGSLDEAMDAIDAQMLTTLGCKPQTADAVLKRLSTFDESAYERDLLAKHITLQSLDDDAYPAALKTIEDPPVFLYSQGSLDVLSQPCIALVGTRDMSGYGRRVAGEVVAELIGAGVVTVSGLADGIDSEVARVSLRGGGRTVAVLGHGFGMMYPQSNRALSQAIVDQGGLLLSEFPLDVRPDKYTFPARNRIIAGLSLATVVLEAAGDSGSLITADLALDYNRQVYAVPGQIFDGHYAGCHELIAQGRAKLITGARDVLLDLGFIVPSRTSATVRPSFDSSGQQKVWQALSSMPQSIDDLIERIDMGVAEAAATLTLLEMRGLVSNIGESKWVKG